MLQLLRRTCRGYRLVATPWRCAATPWNSLRLVSGPSHGSLELRERAQDRILPRAGEFLRLRQYQEECIEAVLQAFREGRRKVGVSLATGSGKTVIFTELISRVVGLSRQATQTLILVHRRELVEQAVRHASKRYPEKTVEIEMGNLHASGCADITIASVQSINSKGRINKFDRRKFKLVLVDEAHHIVAPSYLHILEHFGLQSEANTDPKPALVGVSATFTRADGLALGRAIKHIVYHKDYVEMIGDQWLTDVVFTTVESKADVSKVQTSPNGDFRTGSLSKAVNNPETNLITVRVWLQRASDRQSTLVFCVDHEHLRCLADMFRKHGIDAKSVTGVTDTAVRDARIEDFKQARFPVLLNCGVFTEGTDIPNIDCILIARPTRSRNLLIQMIGRGMRLFPGKKNCQIIDMVASLEHGIVTTPTLFGLDPSEMLEESSPRQMKDMKLKKEAQKQHEILEGTQPQESPMVQDTTGAITFKQYDSVADMVSDTAGERHIRALSQFAWVSVRDRFILTDRDGSYLIIERSGEIKGDFLVRLYATYQNPRVMGSYLFMRPRVIATAETFESCVHAADTFAGNRFLRHIILRRAAWRQKEASQTQVDYLNSKLEKEMGGEALEPSKLSKGEANDMITKLRHGAKGFMKQLDQVKRRQQRSVEKMERRRSMMEQQEMFGVGPLSSEPGDAVAVEGLG